MFKTIRSLIAGRIVLASLSILTVTLSALPQEKLRDAMDYNGDNHADFVIFRPSDSTWYFLTTSGSIWAQPFGIANEDYPTPGDYDGDGIADIAVWRDTNGAWYRIDSSTFTYSVHQWGQTGDEPIARDYDGDGKTDFAIVRKSGGVLTWWVFFIGSNTFNSAPFGLEGDFPAPGDYDGDGKWDFAVQRPGATNSDPSTFYITNSLGYQVIQWGQGRDLVAPGDYDGDGKTDIATVHEGATAQDLLQWNIRYSGGGEFSRFWGVTGTDLLVQNDYDGDGKCDIAIWRNSDGKFWLLYSSNGGIDVWSWGLPNDLPVASYDTH